VLVKPLTCQMEQLSNAKALVLLKLGTVMPRLDKDALAEFLARPQFIQVRYPDIARMIAKWIGAGNWKDIEGISRMAWEQTVSIKTPRPLPCPLIVSILTIPAPPSMVTRAPAGMSGWRGAPRRSRGRPALGATMEQC